MDRRFLSDTRPSPIRRPSTSPPTIRKSRSSATKAARLRKTRMPKFINAEGEEVFYGYIGHTKWDIAWEMAEHLEGWCDREFDGNHEMDLVADFCASRLTDQMIEEHLSDSIASEQMRLGGECSEDAWLDSIAEALDELCTKVGFREPVDDLG